MPESLELYDGRPFGRLFNELKFQPRIQKVEVIDYPTTQAFRESLSTNQYPIVFRSATVPPGQQELISMLESENRPIQVRIGDYARPGTTVVNREYLMISLREYIRQYLFDDFDGPAPYAGRIEFSETLFGSSVQAPCFYPECEFEAPFIWLGARGCVTQLHKDGAKNFAVHLFGRKRWTLYPPRDAPYLYLKRVLEGSDFASSEVDLRDVDQDRFPLFGNAVALSADVVAGQTLFLPEGWAHHVENLEPTLMVNYWHDDNRSIKN